MRIAHRQLGMLLLGLALVALGRAQPAVEQAGLLNLNGGDTTITRRHNSWTRIAGLGVPKDGRFQVFAPNQNENVYTRNWSGPFYGFDQVIETFELTGRPYRFKPVNLYYHTYSASKDAALEALHRVYAWVGRQPLHPVFASDYVRKVLDFNRMVVARTPAGYRIRGGGELRTVRVSRPSGRPDWARSRGLAGMAPAPEGRYLSLSGPSAKLVLAGGRPDRSQPYLAEANARLREFRRTSQGLRFGLAGQVPLEFALAGAGHCRLQADGKPLAPLRRQDGLTHYRLERRHREFDLACGP